MGLLHQRRARRSDQPGAALDLKHLVRNGETFEFSAAATGNFGADLFFKADIDIAATKIAREHSAHRLSDYPKNPQFKATFGPRGALDCKATDKDDPTEDPRFGKVGKQTCKDTGPITRKRMETIEEELLARSVDFMDRSVKAGKPFFLWHNTTRMHVFTRLSPKWENKSGYGLYADGMMELDYVVGTLLKKLNDLGIANNTIVVFTSDNGAEVMSWPDGGNTPFKGEKGTTWEGGMRVPGIVRWPGVIKPGTVVNDIISQEDWLPTLLAAAGDPNAKENLKKGMKIGDKTFKTHLDGYNFLPFLKSEVAKGPRREIFYFDDNANLNALRIDDWKLSFKVIEGNIASATVQTPNMPILINLRMDPFERFSNGSQMYFRWAADKLWMFVPAQVIVGQFVTSFKEFPPSQKSGSFSVDQVLEQLQNGPKKRRMKRVSKWASAAIRGRGEFRCLMLS